MLGRWAVPALVGLALLVSGCTQQNPTGGTPAPDFAVKNIPPSSAPGAAGGGGGLIPGGVAEGALAGGGAAPGSAGGVATAASSSAAPAAGSTGRTAAASGSTAGLGQAIVGCTSGTPWEYSSGSVATPAGYKVTYTIGGKTFFKGAEYCKVSGKVEVTQAGISAAYLPTFDYYFRTDPTGAAYADIWYAYTIAGQTQEFHVLAGAGGATVSGSVTGTGTSTVTGTGASSSPCLQKITFQEVQQIWPAKDTLEGWKFQEPEKSTPGETRYLECRYGADLAQGPAKALTLEFYKVVPVVGWANNYEQECSTNKALGREGAPFSELGTNCASTLGQVAVFKGSVWVQVTCGACTRDQLVSLAKTIAGRL